MSGAHLVLIEAAGKQSYVFSTNKLKQNVGASEIIHRIGTAFVLRAVADELKAKSRAQDAADAYDTFATEVEKGHTVVGKTKDGKVFAGSAMAATDYVARLEKIASEHPIGKKSVPVEVLVATSGKAVLLVDTPERGKDIIAAVTLRALRDTPGVVVRGIVYEDELDIDTHHFAQAHVQMRQIHESINELRLTLPAPEARFPTLPIVAPCGTSGLPAEYHTEDPDGNLVYRSASVQCKQEEADAGWRRVQAALNTKELAGKTDMLDDGMQLPWLAVVHADGNGFGKVFLNLADYMPDSVAKTARDYCDYYRKLSLALDLAGVVALRAGLRVFDKKKVRWKGRDELVLPVVPLVFGGDDLTVVCEGKRAIRFAKEYLRAFEEATEKDKIDGFPSVIPELREPRAKSAGADVSREKKKFGAAAGIAIIKPHHPFHRAYDLAEDLLKSAKKTKRILSDAISALDFQIIYEDAASSLDLIRDDWRVPGPENTAAYLYARPYVVTDTSREDRFQTIESRERIDESREWIECHHIECLETARRELEKGLPRSQQHALRSALFRGVDIANARLALIRNRYKIDWAVFGASSDSLFFKEVEPADGKDKTVYRTRFLDALELIDIEETFELPRAAGSNPPNGPGSTPPRNPGSKSPEDGAPERSADARDDAA